MSKKTNPEKINKDISAEVADKDLRNIPKEEINKIMKWWNKYRTEVGWRRMSKIITMYSKEFRDKNVQ